MSEGGLNLALGSIEKVGGRPWTQGFRPMVSSALWGKAPAARKIKNCAIAVGTALGVLGFLALLALRLQANNIPFCY